jgi:hypothetical protein
MNYNIDGGKKYFHFRGDDNDFHGELESHRCAHTYENTERCKKRVQIGLDLCWIHLLKDRKLRIKESLIPNTGLGLFVEDKNANEGDVIFRKGAVICNYNGDVISYQLGEGRYGANTGPYLISITEKGYREDAALARGVGSLINHKCQTLSNVNFVKKRLNGIYRISIMANKNIRNYSELYVNYGKAYVMNENEYATNNKKRSF